MKRNSSTVSRGVGNKNRELKEHKTRGERDVMMTTKKVAHSWAL